MAALVQGNTSFALSLLSNVPGGGGSSQNMFMAPYTLSAAMAMAYAGANGPTASAIASVFNFSSNAVSLASTIGALDCALVADGVSADGGSLDLANAMFGQIGASWSPSYLGLLENSFSSPLVTVDFAGNPTGATQTINDWIACHTEGMIPNLVQPGDVDPDDIWALVDAVYFHGAWAIPFPPATPQTFHLMDGASIQTNMLAEVPYLAGYYAQGAGGSSSSATFGTSGGSNSTSGTSGQSVSQSSTGQRTRSSSTSTSASSSSSTTGGGSTGSTSAGPAFQILELPVRQGKIAVDLILPADPQGLPALEAWLTSAGLSTALSRVATTQVDVQIPKLHLDEGSFSLSETLTGMGLGLAFTGNADFSGMGPSARGTYIRQAREEAVLDLDEGGVAAAGASILIGGGASAGGPPPTYPAFHADHPFLIVIRDVPTGTVLFLGRVMDPTQN